MMTVRKYCRLGRYIPMDTSISTSVEPICTSFLSHHSLVWHSMLGGSPHFGGICSSCTLLGATISSAKFANNGNSDHMACCRLSNLLQELTLAKDSGRKNIVLDEARLNENPVQRLSRLIRYSFWDSLTRRIDASSIEKAGTDPKDWFVLS